MKLYYSKGTCSETIKIVLHELQLPCQFEAVRLRAKKTESGQDFLRINPKGVVPTLELDNGEILTENVAILIYLVELAKNQSLLPPFGDNNRYRVLEWLSFISSDVHKSCGPLFNASLPEEIKNTFFKPLLEKKLDFINTQIADKTYLVGEAFTLPDAYLYIVMSWLPYLGLELSQWEHCFRYYQNLSERPSIAMLQMAKVG